MFSNNTAVLSGWVDNKVAPPKPLIATSGVTPPKAHVFTSPAFPFQQFPSVAHEGHQIPSIPR